MKRLVRRVNLVLDPPVQLGPGSRSWDKEPEREGQENQKQKSKGSLRRVMAMAIEVI